MYNLFLLCALYVYTHIYTNQVSTKRGQQKCMLICEKYSG